MAHNLENMFAKLYAQVVASSLTQNETIDVRGVFFMMLAMADKGGNVPGVDAAISRIMNVPVEVFQRAALRLQLPDPSSQSQDFEGRRIMPLEGTPGYFIVNYAKYSQIASDAQRREYLRLKKAESRARLSGEASGGGALQGQHNQRNGSAPPLSQTARLGNRPESLEEVLTAGSLLNIPETVCKMFYLHYDARAKQDPNGVIVWVTGEQGEKVVGQWKSLLASWWVREQERAAKEKKNPSRRRDRTEAEKEPETVKINNIKSYGESGESTPII